MSLAQHHQHGMSNRKFKLYEGSNWARSTSSSSQGIMRRVARSLVHLFCNEKKSKEGDPGGARHKYPARYIMLFVSGLSKSAQAFSLVVRGVFCFKLWLRLSFRVCWWALSSPFFTASSWVHFLAIFTAFFASPYLSRGVSYNCLDDLWIFLRGT